MSRGRIEHRAAKVSLVNGISTVLTLVFQLVSVPVCLKFWGTENYGSWLALYSAFIMIRSMDGGFVVFVGNKLNQLYHHDRDALRLHLASAIVGIAAIGFTELIVAVGTLFVNPLAAVLGMPSAHGEGIASALGLTVLVVSWIFTGSYIGIVHRLLIPAGMMYQAAWWAMAFQVTQFAAIISAALLRWSILQTSLVFALAQIIIYISSAVYVRRVLPSFRPWLRRVDSRVGLKDLAQSLMLTASNVIQQSAANGSVLLVSALAGPVAVPLFTTVRTLTNLWTSVTTILTTPLLPEVVRMHAVGEAQKLKTLNEAFLVLVGSVVNWGALLLYPIMPFLYLKWTAHSVSLNIGLLAWMLAGVVVTNSCALMALHLNGINSLRIVLGGSMARALCGLGGGALGYRFFGVSSFGLGILAGEIVAALMTARYFVKHELAGKGIAPSYSSFGAATLGTGSALLFFVGCGFGWWSGGWYWLLAFTGTAAGSAWGWKSLDSDLRHRLVGLAQSWLPGTFAG